MAISATKAKIAVSLRGTVKNIGKKHLDIMFEKNPYMKGIYPGDTRAALEVFWLCEAQGEYFDISDPSNIVRDTIIIGNGNTVQTGYIAGEGCIGCKLCYSVCPQKCIDTSAKPVVINQNHCLHCGRCTEICPKQCIKKRGAAGFYPFPSEEAKWGYWSKHALINRFDPPALPLYKELYDIVKDKEYFVLTTNVDHQFYKAGFADERIFATQGDYGKIQCQRGCHPKTYGAKELFQKIDAARKDCLIPSELVPKCPVCGGNMAMNLRCDNYFVEDEAWHEAADRYADFLEQHQSEKVILIELGVGFNTPIIVRFPFEKMVRENASYSLIRLNKDEAVVPESFGKRAVGIGGDMAHAITDIWRLS